MKKIHLAAIAVLFVIPFVSKAQTNTFPSTGNAGIGTTTPTSKLQVLGETALTFQLPNDFSGGLNVQKRGTTGDATASVVSGAELGYHGFYGWDGSAYGRGIYTLAKTTEAWSTSAHGTSYTIATTANGSTVVTPKFIVDQNGNVGIGTTSPTSFLHVAGSEYAPAASGSAQNSDLRIGANSTGLILDAGINSSATVPYSWLQSRYQSDYTTNYNLVLNPNGGKIGIGTTIPDELLSVLGTIHSKEIKVDLGVPGPDYVFKPDYKLPSLTEVKNYVDKNHHLAEIPSADEMVKNGLNLGDMNTKLLKKVEELTLYLIEKDQQLKIQQERLDKLEKLTNKH